MSLVERLTRLSNEIYERTKANPTNWVHHTHGPDDHADTCCVCQVFGLTARDWAMKNKITGKTRGPLFALADVMVTPKEVRAWLKPKIEDSVAQSLGSGRSFAEAQADARRAAAYALDDRFFSRFGKKKMIDRIVSRALRGYRLKRRSALLDELHRAQSDRDYYGEREVKRLRAKLATGQY